MILNIQPLGFQWQTRDPFLFCAFHEDFFPPGNASFGPAASLAGRDIGMDFQLRDGWRMYHGDTVPGFPGHPHRGFETITIVQKGMVDHADSLGAAGRYGDGDVQWLTTGRGVQHSEMFPLLKQDAPNPLLLFQIWLNLPARNKLVDPHFTMFWANELPVAEVQDADGNSIRIEITAGDYAGVHALPPPPNSWAADPANGVAVWVIDLDANANWTLPAAYAGLNRSLYFFAGKSALVAGQAVDVMHSIELPSDQEIALHNGNAPARMLLLQGKPINEPVAQHGPFVMNSRDELVQAFADYQRDQFGGWPWPRRDHVHAQSPRFARFADGSEVTPEPVPEPLAD